MGNNNKEKIVRLLQYLDKMLYGDKVTETGWNYSGLILDAFFENSVLSIDYLNVEDYFATIGINYIEEKTLEEHLDIIAETKYPEFISAILNILKYSKYDQDSSAAMIKKSEAYLKRQGFEIHNQSSDQISVRFDNELGKGSYCRVIKVAPAVVKKELLAENRNDEKLRKRLKYEFENTKKLEGCTNIIRVYEFNDEECSYQLEEAETNLYDYLNAQVGLTRNDKLKIIMDILNGLKYAHDYDIIHRDLHLGNILKINDSFVISDFGWSKDYSLERSLKSSNTEKNNHYFMDPLAAGDLTKMNMQTDIYSVGKIMEYVYAFDNSNDKLLDYIIAKATARDKRNRYRAVNEIILELQRILETEKEEAVRKEIIKNICQGIVRSAEEQYIRKMMSQGELCNFIVRYKLKNFGAAIMRLEPLEITEILRNIEQGYSEATGYMQFQNYDIFGEIGYFVYIHSQETEIKKLSRSILEGCATYRWNVQSKLDTIKTMEI